MTTTNEELIAQARRIEAIGESLGDELSGIWLFARNARIALEAAQVVPQPGRDAVAVALADLPFPAWWGGKEFREAADAVLAALSTQPAAREALSAQIDGLAAFIVAEVPGEPSQPEGAIDTAIRIIREQQDAEVLATRKDSLTVRTVAELDALPVGSVVRQKPEDAARVEHSDGRWEQGGVAEKRLDIGGQPAWFFVGKSLGYRSHQADILPAVVLYRPSTTPKETR